MGVAELDAQHRERVAVANDLVRRSADGEPQEAVRETLEHRIAYTETLFRREEGLRTLCAYPLLEQHRGQHRRLLNEVLLFRSRFIAGEVADSELSAFLHAWILNHIRDDDRRYGRNLNAHGVR